MARERCVEARKAIAEGRFPSQEKQREKRRAAEAKTFEEFTKRWLEEARMAESTKSMRKSIIDRDILPVLRNRLMAEIGPEDLRNLCAKVKARGAPATAVHVRDIVKQVFGFAALHGEKAPNPADEVGPSSIATFVAKDRAVAIRDPRHAPRAGRHRNPADQPQGTLICRTRILVPQPSDQHCSKRCLGQPVCSWSQSPICCRTIF